MIAAAPDLVARLTTAYKAEDGADGLTGIDSADHFLKSVRLLENEGSGYSLQALLAVTEEGLKVLQKKLTSHRKLQKH